MTSAAGEPDITRGAFPAGARRTSSTSSVWGITASLPSRRASAPTSTPRHDAGADRNHREGLAPQRTEPAGPLALDRRGELEHLAVLGGAQVADAEQMVGHFLTTSRRR